MLGKALKDGWRSGQAMVESAIAMLAALLVFLALFGLSDQIRAKLLVENAAVKCARARAVGYNDFMLRKIARLATMPAAGNCLTADGADGGAPSLKDRCSRIGAYLTSDYEAQANAILDFEYWEDGTGVSASGDGSRATATVVQRRPDKFWFGALAGAGSGSLDGGTVVPISATATVEAHYPEYLQ